MDGQRLRDYWDQEIAALLAAYRQFETLLPNALTQGAAHRGEVGRYVEDLMRTYLRKYLPADLEVLTGFILRPAVKAGENKSRAGGKDAHSAQLDIIVYDTARFPVFQRFGDSAIVPPEGVVAIISVKKTLADGHIIDECKTLAEASVLCRTGRRGPFLALVGPSSSIEKKTSDTVDWIRDQVAKAYPLHVKFDDVVGLIANLEAWAIFKKRPAVNATEAGLLSFKLGKKEQHLPFQLLLSGILSVYYDPDRSSTSRPGFTAFPPRDASKVLTAIPCDGIR